MTFELKLHTVDDSVGVVFPEATRAHLNVCWGDPGWLMDAASGSVRITTNPEVARYSKVVKAVMHSYRDTILKAAE